jgi:quinol monooxygenase YgiN
MFARSTTMRGRPEHVEDGIAMVRDEVMPAVQAMPGCIGMSMLVDRDTGGSIVTSAWDSREALQATEPQVGPMRDRAAQVFGGRPEVREWEIAVLHRMSAVPEDACARVTWTQVAPEQVDMQLHVFRVGTLPQLEDLPGFCSASLLIDRAEGRAALAVVYESAEMLAVSREPARQLRTASIDHMGARVLDVAEFEVALAHLRVPETV